MNARQPTATRRSLAHTFTLAKAVAVIVLITVTGCTSGASSDHPASKSTKTSVAVNGFTKPDLGPKPRPAPPLSDAEADTIHQEQADQQWATLVEQHPSAIRPAVQLVAYASGKALSTAMVKCVTTAGYTANLAEGGNGWDSSGPSSESASIPEEQTAAYAVAIYVCSVQHSARPAPPRTSAELRYLYNYLTKDLAACWTHFGYTLDTAPPTRDEFVAISRRWFPMRSGPGLISEAKLQQACPTRSPLQVE